MPAPSNPSLCAVYAYILIADSFSTISNIGRGEGGAIASRTTTDTKSEKYEMSLTPGRLLVRHCLLCSPSLPFSPLLQHPFKHSKTLNSFFGCRVQISLGHSTSPSPSTTSQRCSWNAVTFVSRCSRNAITMCTGRRQIPHQGVGGRTHKLMRHTGPQGLSNLSLGTDSTPTLRRKHCQ